jgi:threonine/homoserine/homoserine lactone efflux protein
VAGAVRDAAAAGARADNGAPRRLALYHGARFGLLLQLAVGPVCLFVLQTGIERGALRGMAAVAGVASVDALYIAAAGLGVTRWAEGGRGRRALQWAGATIIALFGLDVIGSAFGRALIPTLGSGVVAQGSSSLLSAVLLTASNPLTIVFWAGVFGAKVAAERYGKVELWLFSTGCVLATVAFLTATALGGALVGDLGPGHVLRWLSVAVGCALVYLAIRLALQR